MKNKKIVALLLAAIMALGCLVGCGKDQPIQSSEVETQTQKESEVFATESTEVVELEEKTIQLWLMGPGKQKDSDKVWEAFNEMLQEYVPNTTVEFTIIPAAEYKDEFNRMLAAGEAVDLAWVGYKTNLLMDVADGNLMPLDDLLEEYGQGIIETLGETVIDLGRLGGDGSVYYTLSWQGLLENRYAFWMPTELVNLAGDTWLNDTQAIVDKWYNEEDTVENFGAVIDQFEIYLAACKEAGKLYSGISPAYSFGAWNGFFGTTRYCKDANRVGVAHTQENEFKVIDAVQSEHMRLYAQKMEEFYEKGYIRSDIASVDQSTLTFVNGGNYTDNTVVMYSHNLLTEDAKVSNQSAAGVELSFIRRERDGSLGNGQATAMAVPYCADDAERAIMVLDALYTVPELYQLLIYGIEGEHYTVNGDGTITTPYGASGTADSDYGLKKWTIGTCMNSLVTQADTVGYYEGLVEAEKTAYSNPFVGFVFDNSEVSDICVALKAIDAVYYPQVQNCAAAGTKLGMEGALDKWIEERKAAGVDKVIAEYQRQLDEYIKENNITSW